MKMRRPRGHLSDTQRAVIDDLFKNGLTELEALEKYNISPRRYRKWLEHSLFMQEVNARIDAAIRHSRLVLARYLPLAAERLAQLTVSEKDETSRKACLDLISQYNADVAMETANEARQEDHPFELSDEKAGKLLAVLAEKETPRFIQSLAKTTATP